MASVPRLFVVADLVQDGIVALPKEQAHYLTRVMRLGLGDAVIVFNGRQGEWQAVIDEVIGKSVLLKVRLQRAEQRSECDLVLMFAPLKKARTDFVVEKATELGVAHIAPVITARTQAETVRTDRLTAIATEAAEQTERLSVPVIAEAEKLDAAVARWSPEHPIYYCDEAGDEEGERWGGQAGRGKPMLEALKGLEPTRSAILIGPEGGFSPDERAMLRARGNVIPVTLGPRILRAETAVVAALTIWQAALGDWR